MHDDKRQALAKERDTATREQQDGSNRDTELKRLDGEIRALCSHDSINWDSHSAGDGRIITTCARCGISWYEHAG